VINDQKNIDQLFGKGLSGMRHKPPANAWRKLDHALDKGKYGKRIFYYRLIAASILIFFAFGAGFYYATFLNNKQIVENNANNTNQLNPQADSEFNKMTPTEQESVTVDKNMTANTVFSENDRTDNEIILSNGKVTSQDELNNDQFIQPDTKKQLAVAVPEREITSGTLVAAMNSIRFDKVVSKLWFIDRINMESNYQNKINAYHSIALADDLNNEDFIITPTKKRDHRWTIGAQFAPTYSYREISTNYNLNQPTSQNAKSDLNIAEEALMSYAGGMAVGYNVNSKWSVQSGMYLSRIGQVNNNALEFTQNNDQLLLSAISTSTGYINVVFEQVPENVRKINSPKDTIDIGEAGNVKIIQNFDLFEVPLLVRYKLMDKKLSFNFSGGLSPAYLVKNRTILELNENRYDVGAAPNLNSIIFNSSLGLGIEYHVVKGLTINFEPTFKYALNPINKSSEFNYHPYYFSWFTGIRLRIQ